MEDGGLLATDDGPGFDQEDVETVPHEGDALSDVSTNWAALLAVQEAEARAAQANARMAEADAKAAEASAKAAAAEANALRQEVKLAELKARSCGSSAGGRSRSDRGGADAKPKKGKPIADGASSLTRLTGAIATTGASSSHQAASSSAIPATNAASRARNEQASCAAQPSSAVAGPEPSFPTLPLAEVSEAKVSHHNKTLRRW